MQVLQDGFDLLLVIGMFRDVVPYNQVSINIDRSLRIAGQHILQAVERQDFYFSAIFIRRMTRFYFLLHAPSFRPKLDDEYQENTNHQAQHASQ